SNDVGPSPGAGLPVIKVYDGANNYSELLQVAAFQADQTMPGTNVPVVTSITENLASGFLFKYADPDPTHPNQVATGVSGTNSVALGNVNSLGTRDLLVGHGIGQRALQTTISVNSQVLSPRATLLKPKV